MSVRSRTAATALYATLAGALLAIVAYALIELAARWWMTDNSAIFEAWRIAPR